MTEKTFPNTESAENVVGTGTESRVAEIADALSARMPSGDPNGMQTASAPETENGSAPPEKPTAHPVERLAAAHPHNLSGTGKRRKKVRIGRFLGRGILFLLVFAFSLVFLFPTVFTITNSFMSESEINANYGAIFATGSSGGKTYISDKVNLKLIPDMVTFQQYYTVLFKSPDYLLKFWNAVILVVPIVVFQIIVACLASYGFARYRGKFREVLFFSYIVLMFMPYQVTLVPNYLVSKFLGILETRWAVILPGIFSPFAVFLLTKSMRRIPESIIEAARLDGAGELQICMRICIPACRSSLFSVIILIFIDYWNMVEQFLVLLTDSEKFPLSVFLSEINTGEISLAFAVAVIYMVPTLLLFLFGEEYLVEGISSSGGLKD